MKSGVSAVIIVMVNNMMNKQKKLLVVLHTDCMQGDRTDGKTVTNVDMIITQKLKNANPREHRSINPFFPNHLRRDPSAVE